jgi:hypothetical protein
MFYASGRSDSYMMCKNNLTQLSAALHAYYFDHGCFPPFYTMDEKGTPMHNWRALILPYVESDKNFYDYDYNSPWNSPHNQKLHNKMPSIFKCPFSYGKTDNNSPSYELVPDENFHSCKLENHPLGLPRDMSKYFLLVETRGADYNWLEPVEPSRIFVYMPGQKDLLGFYHDDGMFCQHRRTTIMTKDRLIFIMSFPNYIE